MTNTNATEKSYNTEKPSNTEYPDSSSPEFSADKPQNCFEIFGSTGTPPHGNPQTIDLGEVKLGKSTTRHINFFNFHGCPNAIFQKITWPGENTAPKTFPFTAQPLSKTDPLPDISVLFTPKKRGDIYVQMRVHFALGYSDFYFKATTP